VNKMDSDTAGYKEERYKEIRDEMKHMLARVGWKVRGGRLRGAGPCSRARLDDGAAARSEGRCQGDLEGDIRCDRAAGQPPSQAQVDKALRMPAAADTRGCSSMLLQSSHTHCPCT
jgi:hypothetical protein